ncbi:MAG: hypothetical protein IPL78_15020 [Chloroflexi bacterium]|nr:hypothetical protein [Chloroflexota bacterium]
MRGRSVPQLVLAAFASGSSNVRWRTLADLYLLRPKATSDEERSAIDRTLFCTVSFTPLITPFRYRHYPIGSGSVDWA